MTLTELKAQAYDILAQIEFLQVKLKETNDAIGQKMKEEQDGDGEAVS